MSISFVVEDGTKPTGANSYCTLAFYRQYWENRGVDQREIQDNLIQSSLIAAADYIDSLDFKGYYSESDQPMEWPRADVLNKRGVYYESTEIPEDVKKAACEIAKIIMDSGPIEEMETGAKSETLGPSSTTYEGARKESDFIKKGMKYLDFYIDRGLNRA